MAYTVEDLLSVLHPHCPVKVDALCKNRRRVEHGLTQFYKGLELALTYTKADYRRSACVDDITEV